MSIVYIEWCLKYTFSAWNIASTRPSDSLPDGESKSLEGRLGSVSMFSVRSLPQKETNIPMMVVFTAQDIHMQRHTGRHGKRVEDVREHLRGEVPDLLAFDAEVAHAVRARADVDDRAREGLYEARASLH